MISTSSSSSMKSELAQDSVPTADQLYSDICIGGVNISKFFNPAYIHINIFLSVVNANHHALIHRHTWPD